MVTPRNEVRREIARLLAGRTIAALAMAGQTYRIEVRPDDAFNELIDALEPWVERNVHVPEAPSAGSCRTERGE